MTQYIAILRGINVGGKRKILMKDLQLLFKNLDFENVSTYIQSGNVFFTSDQKAEKISATVKNGILAKYEFNVPVVIRTASEIKNAFENNPFLKENAIEKLHLSFLSNSPTSESIEKLKQATSTFSDKFEIIGNNVFILCQDKYHKSKLSTNFFEKKLRLSATTRNWKTVTKLHELSIK